MTSLTKESWTIYSRKASFPSLFQPKFKSHDSTSVDPPKGQTVSGKIITLQTEAYILYTQSNFPNLDLFNFMANTTLEEIPVKTN